MKAKHIVSVMLAILMVSSIFIPAVQAAGESKGIDLNASIKEPKPEIGITVDVDHISFGELLPGETSASHAVAVTNVGLKAVDTSVEVEDDGTEAIFVPGLLIDGDAWGNYSAQLVSDDSDSFDVALHVPETVTTRGAISGSMVVWAEAIETPVAEFSADVTTGVAPLTVQFTDGSTGATSWRWNFGDGTNSSEQNPSHLYSAAGTYTVSLTVGNLAGSDNEIKTAYITVGSPASDFTYTSSGSAITITGYSGPDGNVIIPDEINGLPVTAIGANAFQYGHMTSVVIPNGVTSIGSLAFRACFDLVSVTLPDSVKTIGNNAFLGCAALTSVVIPNNVTSIGASTFYSCISLTSVTIGSGVTSIGVQAFYGCESLASLTIPDSVTTIDNAAFLGCTGLASISIGRGVTSIGSNAFNGCAALVKIDIDAGNSAFTSVDGVLYNDNATTLIRCPEGKSGSMVIPDGVTAVGDNAFLGCAALTSVTVPDSVTAVGSGAFDGCTSLRSIGLGNGLTAIADRMFNNCPSLTSVTIPDSVKTLGQKAFSGCSALASIVIGNGVTTIANEVFQGCAALTSVTIGSGVTSISYSVFYGCSALTAINVVPGNPTYSSFDGILYDKDRIELIKCPEGKSGSLAIPSGVDTIDNYAFDNNNALTSIMVPDSVTWIGDRAFYDCTALTTVTIGSGATRISIFAFDGCTALTDINIHADNTKYFSADGALYERGSTALTLIKCPGGKSGSLIIPSGATAIGQEAFNGCPLLTSVEIPDSVTSYHPMAFDGCPSLAAINVHADNVKYSSWEGVLYDKSSNTPILCPPGKTGTVNIPDGVTSIGDNVFKNCNAVVSVNIPDSVTRIGNSAFYKCTALTSITIPDSVTSIGTSVFSGCTALASVTIGSGITILTNQLFYDCTALTTVTIPDNVTEIINNAFQGCTALTTVTIGNGVTKIGNGAFILCAALTSVTIGSGVKSIGDWAFSQCTSLTTMEFAGNAPTVGTSWANRATNLVVYYNVGATGFTTPKWQGVSCYPMAAPVAAFSADVTSGLAPLTVRFSDLSTNRPTAWAWDFDNDGIVDSYEQNPSWTYSNGGTYTVKLTVSNAYGSDEEVKTGYVAVTESSLIALFSTDVTSGRAPLSVHFIDQSYWGPTAWAWDFDNDGTVDSTEQNPSYTYNAPGTYTVKLTVSNAYGSDDEVKIDLITVLIPYPDAEFSVDRRAGLAPLTAQFTDLSISATAWAWDFDNDGTVDSTEQNPSYTYNAPGTYTVKLTVSNAYGSDTEIKVGYVVVGEAPAEEAWTNFQGNQQLNGYYAGNAPDDNNVKWVSDAIDAWPSSSFAIAEGKVFVYCYNETDEKAYIAALYVENGTIAWIESMLTNPLWDSWATPAYHDGLVFTAGDTARYASNGTIAWPDGRTVGTASTTNGGPMIAEGKVFIGDWDGGKYYALDEKTGAQIWEFTAGGYAQGTPSYHDGKIFLTSWAYPGGNVYCVNASDGTEIWHANTGLDTCGSPAIADGFVYVTTYNFGGDGDIFCFYESNGTQVWTQKIQRTDSTPTVYDGKVYVTGGCYGVSPHQTYCFDAFDGTPIWSTTEEQDIGGWTASVVVSADGKVFVGREGAWGEGESMRFGYIGLFALDAFNGTVLWEAENGGGTVAIYDGVVFTAGADGKIYAYGPAEA